MNILPVALAIACVLCACSSSSREPLETRLKQIRTYGWPATVVDPSPQWNPNSNVLVARSQGGFALLEEGGQGVRQFDAEDRRDSCLPVWLNGDQFVFGPSRNAIPAGDGTISKPSDGLTVATFVGLGKPQRTQLTDRGYRPRRSGDNLIVAQDGNIIIRVDAKGDISEFGEGFDPEPQPNGPGLAWRTTPAFDTDWWTGHTGPGTMFVRWTAGRVDNLGNAMQACWTRRGGVIATVVNLPAADGQPWWSGGTRLVHIARPGAPIETLRRDGRDPAAHPLAEIMAWVDADNVVWIGTQRLDGWAERISDAGRGPVWSADGKRLCFLELPKDGSQIPTIRVAVLALR